MQIGEKIKQVRKSKKMSQTELSKRSGMAMMSIRRYESGEREPRMSDVNRIAAALGVDVDFLLKGDEPKKGYFGTLKLEGLTDKEIIEQGERLVASTRQVYKATNDATRVPLQLHGVFEKYGISMQDYFDMMSKYDSLIEALSAEYRLTSEQFNNLLDDIRAIIDADE